jgi:hypothetical protein
MPAENAAPLEREDVARGGTAPVESGGGATDAATAAETAAVTADTTGAVSGRDAGTPTDPIANTAASERRGWARRTVSVTEGRATGILFAVLLGVGIALRLVLFFTDVFTVDSDNAIVYLIAKHASEGNIAWFFWGQPYGGTLLQLIAGAVMVVTGPQLFVLSTVSVLFFALGAVLVRAIGRATLGALVGDVAGILFFFSGFFTMRLSVIESGFYGPSLVFGLATVWFALRKGPQKTYLQWAVIGLLAGFALWQSPMAIAIAAPGVVLAAIRQRSWRHIVVGAVAGIIGGLPWIVQFAVSSAAIKPQGSGAGIQFKSFVTFFTQLVPASISVAGRGGTVVGVLAVALLVLCAVIAIRRRSWMLGAVIIGAVVVVGVVVVGTGILLGGDSVRYIVFVLPALTITLAYLLTRVRFLGIVAMSLAVVLTATQTVLLHAPITFDTSQRYIVGNISGLGDYLTEHHVTAAFGDYWLAYSVSAETNEAVTVASLSEPRRYAPYETAAAAQPQTTIIVFATLANDQALQARTDLPAHTRVEADGYAIYTFATPFDPYQLSWELY